MIEHLKNIRVGALFIGALITVITLIVGWVHLIVAYPIIAGPIALIGVAWAMGKALRSA